MDADGGLDVERLLVSFQRFFREHSEHWAARFEYAEAGPQLILQGFLHRIVNGGRSPGAGVRDRAGPAWTC